MILPLEIQVLPLEIQVLPLKIQLLPLETQIFTPRNRDLPLENTHGLGPKP